MVNQNDILQPGHNCWKTTHADKVGVLIDGEAYFGAFHQALRHARDSVYILSWDIDSRMRLIRKQDSPSDWPEELGSFISAVLRHQPDLNIYILNWDWAMVYTLEREWLPMYKPAWKKQKRLHFELDGSCPLGASQHQKVVVIDDLIAFSGGFDLGKHRWDSSEHAADDQRRVDPDEQAYPPFHDVQLMVSGEAARTLGELARERWWRATGKQLSAPEVAYPAQWPAEIESWFDDVDIGIARTLPRYDDYPEVREVEQLYVDSIPAARELIYIENQYFTSWRVADLLADSLSKEEGPDIVMVLPLMTGGWLEQVTMDVLRHRVICRLQSADQYQRLRVCYPHNVELGDSHISVHAKIMVIDDRLMRVGSANLSNRSMGLDSECDLAIEAKSEQQQARIRQFRERLLAEHFGLDTTELNQQLEAKGSLIKLIDDRQDRDKTLKPLDCQVSEWAEQLLPSSALVDPEKPIEPEQMTEMFVPIEQPRSFLRRWWKLLTVLLVLIGMMAVWRWTPLNDYLKPESLQVWAEWIKDHPLTPLLVLSVFSIAGLLAFPVTLLIVTTALTFGPLWGSIYSMLGAVISALLGYWLGRVLGRKSVQKLSGSNLNRLNRRLAKHGILAVITVRIVPVAPFTMINLVSGATHIKARDYLLGTVLGMLPGVLGITVFADSLVKAVLDPEPAQIAIFVLIALVVIAVMFGLKTWLGKTEDEEDSATP